MTWERASRVSFQSPARSPITVTTSREHAHEASRREAQEGFEPFHREASSGGAELVELELQAAARRLPEREARRHDDLPRTAHPIRGAERGEPATVAPRTEGEDGRDEVWSDTPRS